MEYGEEVGVLGIFEPQRLSESIKFEPKNCFCCSIFPIQLLELFLQDRVIRVVVVVAVTRSCRACGGSGGSRLRTHRSRA